MPEATQAITPEQSPARDYIDKTRAFWQPYAGRELTREDGRSMAYNLVGFFSVLREWTLRERELARLGIEPSLPLPPPKRGRPRKNTAPGNKTQP